MCKWQRVLRSRTLLFDDMCLIHLHGPNLVILAPSLPSVMGALPLGLCSLQAPTKLIATVVVVDLDELLLEFSARQLCNLLVDRVSSKLWEDHLP